MPVEVQIPSLLRKAAGGEKQVRIEGDTVGEIMQNLTAKYPALKDRLLTADGKLQPFIVLYVNDDDARFLQEMNTPLKDGDIVSILPAVAGGGSEQSETSLLSLLSL